MKAKYTIKNFRGFDANGVEFKLAPITLLTGVNGAGKSSLVKSLLVLKSYLANNEVAYNKHNALGKVSMTPSSKTPLLFTDSELKLGRFDNVLNHNSASKEMTFEYQIESASLGCPIKVSLTFCPDDKDEMNNGWLSHVTITNLDGETIYDAVMKENELQVVTFKFSWFKSRFLKFGLVNYASQAAERMYADSCIGVDPSLEVTEESTLAHQQLFSQFKTLIDSELSSEEKQLFGTWLKQHDEAILSSNSWERFFKSIEYGCLNLATEFITSLCEQSKDDAMAQIADIHLTNDFDACKVERIKSAMIESLTNSKHTMFKDWLSKQEDTYLDSMLPVRIQAFALMQMTDVVDVENGEPEVVNSAEATPVDFHDMIALLYLADREYCTKALQSPIDMLGLHDAYQDAFYRYVHECVLSEVLVPDFAKSLHYIGSAQVSVQRLYSSQTGNNAFTDLLLRYFEAKRNYSGAYIPDTFLNKWIKYFEIGDSITLKNTSEGFGLVAMLHKVAGDKGTLLADEGYGITQLLSILLNIEVAILSAPTKLAWGDALYVIKAARKEKGEIIYMPQTLAIEEPENHLHPRLQSLLADMFYDAYTTYNIQFIVETHSEYLIRKSQVLVAQQKFATNIEAEEKALFQCYYLPRVGAPYSLGYRKDGKFVNDFGNGFYDESANLMFEIL